MPPSCETCKRPMVQVSSREATETELIIQYQCVNFKCGDRSLIADRVKPLEFDPDAIRPTEKPPENDGSLGQAIMTAKDIFPDKTASERADIIAGLQLPSNNGSSTKIHK